MPDIFLWGFAIWAAVLAAGTVVIYVSTWRRKRRWRTYRDSRPGYIDLSKHHRRNGSG